MLRKAFTVEKDLDWRLLFFFFFCLGFWRSCCQSSLSGGSHRGSVLLGKLLVPRGSELLSVSKLMSLLKVISRFLISISVSHSSGDRCTGDTGGGNYGSCSCSKSSKQCVLVMWPVCSADSTGRWDPSLLPSNSS